MTTILERLAHATEGSRELSDEILLACGWIYDPKRIAAAWRSPDESWQGFHDRPDPSRCHDDAARMVPAGLSFGSGVNNQGRSPYAWAWVMVNFNRPMIEGATEALALSRAALKAHQSQTKTVG